MTGGSVTDRADAARAIHIRIDGVKREPFVVQRPVEFAIVFHRREMAAKAAKHEGVERSGEREITIHTDTYLAAVERAWAVIEWTANELPEWLQ